MKNNACSQTATCNWCGAKLIKFAPHQPWGTLSGRTVCPKNVRDGWHIPAPMVDWRSRITEYMEASHAGRTT